jgi:hypothetical protein
MTGGLRVAAIVLPVLNVAMAAAWALGFVRGSVFAATLVPAIIVVGLTQRQALTRFDLLDARKAHLLAFARMIAVVEGARFDAPLLERLRTRCEAAERPASHHLKRLASLAGWADFRQVILHPLFNVLLLWDLHVLWGLERWNGLAGALVQTWLEALGELEALSSLAALRTIDPDCSFPRIVPAEEGLECSELAHPLLAPDRRVANDVRVEGPSALVIVTGSNMAGKSTLLRAVGTNIALALAGGPVCAKEMRVPVVRLRASMRVRDSLQTGASYFYAELRKLKAVVAEAEAAPPIFFLFDELLRGTNAVARIEGARAILAFLRKSGAMGLIATHDDALCSLADEPGVRATNIHFTDVIVDGEMTFDYRLRPGSATTSNALHLLQRAGIPVPDSPLGSENRISS